MKNAVKYWLLLAVFAVSQSYVYSSVHNNGEHSVHSLAEICLEAENDARDAAEEEAYCEQYLSGFAAALVLTRPGIYCFPTQEPLADKYRVSFTVWYFQNRKLAQLPAGEGLLKLADEKFRC